MLEWLTYLTTETVSGGTQHDLDGGGFEAFGRAAVGEASPEDSEAALTGGSSSSSSSSPPRRLHVSKEDVDAFHLRGEGQWEDSLRERWAGRRCCCQADHCCCRAPVDGCQEYRLARSMVAVHHSLMSDSRLGRSLLYLRKASRSGFSGSVLDILTDFHEVFEPSLLVALKMAFGLASNVAARNEARAVPGVAAHEGNFYDAAIKMYGSLPVWKKPLLSSALRELLTTEDQTGMQVVLGMMKESILHCDAGKVDVWTRIVLRVRLPADEVPDAEALSMSPSTESLRRATDRLWESAFAFIDDRKAKVFTTVFMEPTKMYYIACNETELADNVEVHGSSVYLAVLLSTLGIWCPRLPFFLDVPMSAVSFLDALDENQVAELWAEESNLGKDFRSVAACREPRISAPIRHHWSSFLFHGAQPWQIANAAIDPEGPTDRRERLRPYIERFAHFFSAEVIVPRLVEHLLSSEETVDALQLLWKSRPDLSGNLTENSGKDDETDDVRMWLWDLEVLPAVLRLERARSLLDAAGLLRSSS